MKLLTEKIELPFEDGTGEIIDDCAEKRDQLNKSISKFLDDATKIVNDINKLKESLNEDLKIVIGLDDFKPWSGAVDTFNKILEADKMDELDALLEDTYPDGIGETELNDLLWFDSDYILDALGLAEENEDEDL